MTKTQQKQTPFSAILFDLDGTLLDTAPDFEFCLNQLLREEKRAVIPSDKVRIAVNYGLEALIELGFGTELELAYFNQLKERLAMAYLTENGNHSVLFPGIKECILKLNEHNIPWAIVTNKYAQYTDPLIRKIPDFKHAKIIVSGDTLPYAKPHPAPLHYACENMKVDPKQALYVGDAQRDVEAALAANMQCVLATYGYICPTLSPKTWGAHYYIQEAAHLIEIIFN